MPDEAVAPSPASRSLRIWYAVVQLISLSVFLWLCWIARGFENIYAELGMSDHPFPTEVAIAIGKFARTPIGVSAAVGLGAVLVVLGLSGKLDRFLRNMIVGNVVGTGFLTVFYVFYIYAPIVKIQEVLKDR